MTSSKRHVLFPDSPNGLPIEEHNYCRDFKTRGYATAAIGKWHLGHLPKFLPEQGFDYYYGIPYSNDMDSDQWGEYLKLAEDPNYFSKTGVFSMYH